MSKYTPEQYLQLIPQDAVKTCFIDAPGYNAAWDHCITPDGRHFLPCCAEGSFPEYVKLYEYLPATHEMKLCFDMEKCLVTYPRTIRPSKIHTSLNAMPDGRLIMCTHTTASAPTHPHWMPEAYYTHMWEGFMGSNVIIYDPATGKLEDLGIPVPRESMYGAFYLPQHNCLIMIGYARGHVYRFNLSDRSVIDYGQCLEYGVYLLHMASDGNLYFSTRNGDLWRFNTATLQPEYTGIEIPRHDRPRVMDNCFRLQGANRTVFAHAANGPDNKIYFITHAGSRFFSYDPRTNQLETLGNTSPAGIREDYPESSVGGLAFDEQGMLWYTVTCGFYGKHLCRINILDPNAEPEDLGLIGTRNRVCMCIEDIYIRDDVLYVVDTNYELGCPGLYAIDLKTVRESADVPRELCQDVVVFFKGMEPVNQALYSGDLLSDGKPLLEERAKHSDEWPFIGRNPFSFGKGLRYVGKLWKKFGVQDSQVKAVSFDADGNALAWIGANGGLRVTIRDGEVLKTEASTDAPFRDTAAIEARFAGYTLPSHPGRQYLAIASACADLVDGSVLVGTRDGMLALIRGENVFSLGSVCNDGPVHDLAVSPDGTRAYGVAGDPDSLGMIFSYDINSGVELGGYLYYENCAGHESVGISCVPRCIAVSPDGKRVAIGVQDNLGCVYEIEV